MVNIGAMWQRWMNYGGCQNPPGRPDRVLFLKMVILFHPPGEWLCTLLYLMHCVPNVCEVVAKTEPCHSAYLCLQVEGVCLLLRP